MVNIKISLFALLSPSVVFAHRVNRPQSNPRHAAYIARRQAAGAASPTVPAAPPISAITSGMPTETPVALFTSFAPGATPLVKGAPVLPSNLIDPTKYPPLDITPPTNDPQLQKWLAAVAAANIPNDPITKDGSCASDPGLVPNAGPNGTCWWTCGNCLAPTDISVCPEKDVWGVSYDDGPGDYTPKLLDYLNEKQLLATFFVVGSRAISRPATLQAEYMLGHEISVHTWSHPALTSLTNQEIVAELGWTMIAIKNILGVTPITFRPPYGDIDNRVRAVAKAMGLTPIIWTGAGDDEFDTDDWRIPGGTATGPSSLAAFNKILDLAAALTTGFIVLEHDLFQQTVDMAYGYFLPLAQQRSFTLKPIYDCLGQSLESRYMETAGGASNGTSPTGGSSSSSSNTLGSSTGGGSSATGSGSKTSSKPTGSATSSGNAGQASPSGAAFAKAGFSGSAVAVAIFTSVGMMLFGARVFV